MKKFVVAAMIVVAGLVITDARRRRARPTRSPRRVRPACRCNLTKYNPDGNTVAVSIDDRTVLTGFEGEHTSNLSNPDKTVAHTWSVVVTSGDGRGVHEGGTIPVCETPTTDHDDGSSRRSLLDRCRPVAVVAPPRTAG